MAGQTGWVIRAMMIMNKRISIAIITVDPLVGSYPQNAGSIHVEGPNTVAPEAVGILIVVLVNLECVPVVAVQTAEPGAKPHESLMVLGNCSHVGVRESIGHRKVGEAEFGRMRNNRCTKYAHEERHPGQRLRGSNPTRVAVYPCLRNCDH